MSFPRIHTGFDFSHLMRSVGRYFLLVIFTFLLCFQQTASQIFTNAQTNEFTKWDVKPGISNVSHSLYVTSATVPSWPVIDQLEPVEDEDDHHLQSAYLLIKSRCLNFSETVFSTVIRSVLRKQSSVVQKMIQPPLFALHHQWKSAII